MNTRFFLVFAIPIALGVAAAATAAIPASFSATSLDGFETEGAVPIQVGYTGSGLNATLTVDVEDCGTFTYSSATSGSTSRVPPTTYWSLDLDLSACRAEGAGIERTHHCDGYGNTFETCELDEYGETGADRAVTMSLQMTNRGGVALCATDVDGDGDTECDVVTGTLLADDGGGVTEIYVPSRYWREDDGDWTCISRTSGHGVRDPEDQGGTSCEDLGL